MASGGSYQGAPPALMVNPDPPTVNVDVNIKVEFPQAVYFIPHISIRRSDGTELYLAMGGAVGTRTFTYAMPGAINYSQITMIEIEDQQGMIIASRAFAPAGEAQANIQVDPYPPRMNTPLYIKVQLNKIVYYQPKIIVNFTTSGRQFLTVTGQVPGSHFEGFLDGPRYYDPIEAIEVRNDRDMVIGSFPLAGVDQQGAGYYAGGTIDMMPYGALPGQSVQISIDAPKPMSTAPKINVRFKNGTMKQMVTSGGPYHFQTYIGSLPDFVDTVEVLGSKGEILFSRYFEANTTTGYQGAPPVISVNPDQPVAGQDLNIEVRFPVPVYFMPSINIEMSDRTEMYQQMNGNMGGSVFTYTLYGSQHPSPVNLIEIEDQQGKILASEVFVAAGEAGCRIWVEPNPPQMSMPLTVNMEFDYAISYKPRVLVEFEDNTIIQLTASGSDRQYKATLDGGRFNKPLELIDVENDKGNLVGTLSFEGMYFAPSMYSGYLYVNPDPPQRGRDLYVEFTSQSALSKAPRLEVGYSDGFEGCIMNGPVNQTRFTYTIPGLSRVVTHLEVADAQTGNYFEGTYRQYSGLRPEDVGQATISINPDPARVGEDLMITADFPNPAPFEMIMEVELKGGSIYRLSAESDGTDMHFHTTLPANLFTASLVAVTVEDMMEGYIFAEELFTETEAGATTIITDPAIPPIYGSMNVTVQFENPAGFIPLVVITYIDNITEEFWAPGAVYQTQYTVSVGYVANYIDMIEVMDDTRTPLARVSYDASDYGENFYMPEAQDPIRVSPYPPNVDEPLDIELMLPMLVPGAPRVVVVYDNNDSVDVGMSPDGQWADYFTGQLSNVERPITKIQLIDPNNNEIKYEMFFDEFDLVPPTGFNVSTSSGSSSAYLYWNQMNGVKGYRIYFGTQTGQYDGDIYGSGGPSPIELQGDWNTNCELSGLASGTQYYFSVVSLDYSNYESSFSEEKSVIIGSSGDSGGGSGTTGGVLNIMESNMYLGMHSPGEQAHIQFHIKNEGYSPFERVREDQWMRLSRENDTANHIDRGSISFSQTMPMYIASGNEVMLTMYIMIPASLPDGEYGGWLTFGNDYDNDNMIDPEEPQDSVWVGLHVGTPSGTLSVNPNPPTVHTTCTITFTSDYQMSRLPKLRVGYLGQDPSSTVTMSGAIPGTSFTYSFFPQQLVMFMEVVDYDPATNTEDILVQGEFSIPQVQNVSAVNTGNGGEIQVSWTPVTGASYYRIFWDNYQGHSGELGVSGGNSSMQYVTGLSDGTQYGFTVAVAGGEWAEAFIGPQSVPTAYATPSNNNQINGYFSDSAGTLQANFAVGQEIYVTIEDPAANISSTTRDQISTVKISSPDEEMWPILLETGYDTGIFINTSQPVVSVSDWGSDTTDTLKVQVGQDISLYYMDIQRDYVPITEGAGCSSPVFFSDGAGNERTQFVIGDNDIYVTVDDPQMNTNPTSPDVFTAWINVQSSPYDTLQLTLVETDDSSGIFRNESGVETTSDAGSNYSNTLYVQHGDTIEVTHEGDSHQATVYSNDSGGIELNVVNTEIDFGTYLDNVQTSQINFEVQNLTTNSSFYHVNWYMISPLESAEGKTIDSSHVYVYNISSISPGSSHWCTVYVFIPDNQDFGTYTGTLRIYNDSDDSGFDWGDPQDTVELRLTVSADGTELDIHQTQVETGGSPGTTTPSASFTMDNDSGVFFGNLTWFIEGDFLTSAGDHIAQEKVTISLPSNLSAGSSTSVPVTVTIDSGQSIGTYSGTIRVYDNGNGGGYDGTEPSDTFQLSVEVFEQGTQLNIDQSSLNLGSPNPGQNSNTVYFDIYNNSGSMFSMLHYVVEEEPNDGSGHTIEDFDVIVQVPSYIGPAGNAEGSVYIEVDPTQAYGTYTGRIRVYNDNGTTGFEPASDPSDTIEIVVEVSEAPALDVTETTVDMGTHPKGAATGTYNFTVENDGGTMFMYLKGVMDASFDSAGTQLSDVNVTITPPGTVNPHSSNTGTIAVNIPGGQADGIYNGIVRIFEDPDDDNIADPEEHQDTFAVTLEVSGGVLVISQNELVFGSHAAGTDTGNQSFTVENDGGTMFMYLKGYLSEPLEGPGSYQINTVTITPPGMVNPYSQDNGTMSVQIPAGAPAGTYNGMLLVYEDPDDDGMADPEEAQDTVPLTLTVTAGGGITVDFTNASGGSEPTFTIGDSDIYVTVEDPGANTMSAMIEEVTVVITSQTTGDTVNNILLQETDLDTGVFRNATGIMSETGSALADTILQASDNETIQVSYDGGAYTDTATMKVAGGSSISITETSLAFGEQQRNYGTTGTHSFTVVNESPGALNGVYAFLSVDFDEDAGSDVMGDTYMTITMPSSIAFNSSVQCEVALTWIIPTQSLGTYTGEMTVFVDNLTVNGALDSGEPFDTIPMTIEIIEAAGGGTTSSCTFTNSTGSARDVYTLGVSYVYVTVEDADENVSPGTQETVEVTVQDLQTGDSETLTLQETGNDTGIFRNSSGFETALLETPVTADDGILEAQDDDQLQVTYTDHNDGSDTSQDAATIEATEGSNVPTKSEIAFVDDSMGSPEVSSYMANDYLFVRVIDYDEDKTTSPDSITVTVSDASSSDFETLTLYETGNETGVFVNTSPGMIITQATVQTYNGTLEVYGGDLIEADYDDPDDSDSAHVTATIEPLPSGGETIAQVECTDATGGVQSSYTIGTDQLFITVRDLDENETGGLKDTVTVTIHDFNTGDTISDVVLTETGDETGVFRNTSGITIETGTAITTDNILQAADGDQIQVYYEDGDYPSDNMTESVYVTGGFAQGDLVIRESVVDAGGVSPGNISTPIPFEIRNTASMSSFDDFKVIKSTLTSGADSISENYVIVSNVPTYLGPGASQTAEVTVEVPSLQPSGTYSGYITVYFDVNGDGSLNGGEPNDMFECMVTVVSTVNQPPTFRGVETASATSNSGEVKLTWEAASDDATAPANIRYNIFYGTSIGSLQPYTQVTGQTLYTFTNLTIGTTYFFMVRAEDDQGYTENNAEVISARPGGTISRIVVSMDSEGKVGQAELVRLEAVDGNGDLVDWYDGSIAIQVTELDGAVHNSYFLSNKDRVSDDVYAIAMYRGRGYFTIDDLEPETLKIEVLDISYEPSSPEIVFTPATSGTVLSDFVLEVEQYVVVWSGGGSAVQVPVIVSAIDASSQLINDYAGTIELQIVSGDDSTVTWGVIDGAGTLNGDQYTFDAADNGEVVLELRDTYTGGQTIGIQVAGITDAGVSSDTKTVHTRNVSKYILESRGRRDLAENVTTGGRIKFFAYAADADDNILSGYDGTAEGQIISETVTSGGSNYTARFSPSTITFNDGVAEFYVEDSEYETVEIEIADTNTPSITSGAIIVVFRSTDTTPPEILKARAESPYLVRVFFSETVDQETVFDLNNYYIAGKTVHTVCWYGDQMTIHLEEAMVASENPQLVVQGKGPTAGGDETDLKDENGNYFGNDPTVEIEDVPESDYLGGPIQGSDFFEIQMDGSHVIVYHKNACGYLSGSNAVNRKTDVHSASVGYTGGLSGPTSISLNDGVGEFDVDITGSGTITVTADEDSSVTGSYICPCD
ncbi:MAG: fibronectin type III domain-containing protein [Candidatus Omnitrophica bacterium]|nr:fibronectin type III domain-containing protein [Candidatus Omnitrophota bacterium]